MEIVQLRCFLAVADALHFSRAAEQMHLSQPALSTQIDRLEQELGVLLFERSHQKTALTRAGQIYRNEAQDILAKATCSVERARLAAQGKIGRIRMGFISTAAAYVIPTLIASFRKDHPDVELDLRHHLTAEQLGLIKSKVLDVGFLRLPLLERRGLCTILVHREPFKLFLPASHPLAAQPDLELQHLDGAEFVTYSRRNAPGYAAAQSQVLSDAGIRPAAVHEASDMYTLSLLVAAGVGIAIAPASLRSYRLPGVIIRDLPGLQPSEIAIVHREEIDHPAALAFINSARSMTALFS